MGIAHRMVEMGMGVEHVGKGEPVAADIVVDGLMLTANVCTVVDDNGFLGLITYDIAVFLYHVYNKALDIEHGLYGDIEYFLCFEVWLAEVVADVCQLMPSVEVAEFLAQVAAF